MRDIAGEAKAGLREDDFGDLGILQDGSFDDDRFQLPTKTLLDDRDAELARQYVGNL